MRYITGTLLLAAQSTSALAHGGHHDIGLSDALHFVLHAIPVLLVGALCVWSYRWYSKRCKRH